VQFIVEKLRLITRFFPSESLNSLYPLASLRPLVESIANLAAVDADIFQISIAEMAQGDKVRLALAVCDHAVDETAEARQKNSGSSADRGRGVACRGVEHRHGFFLSKGLALRASPSCWISMHVAAFQDFQRTAICSPNAREMRLRCQAAVLIRLVPTDVPSGRIAARTAVKPISEDTRSPLFTGHQTFEILTIYSPEALATPLRQFHFV